jgi:ABC-type dipeptide/oligopeptide/nickel transport system permease subunit
VNRSSGLEWANLTHPMGLSANRSNRLYIERARGAYNRWLISDHTKGDVLVFASVTAKVVTAVCAVVGAIALLGTFFLTITGGSPYLEFGLALVFFAMFLVGSYWWMVFGPGRVL